MPGDEEYKTSFEKIYGKTPPSMEGLINFLGKHADKETPVAAKSGTIDIPTEKQRKVILFRDHNLALPELWYSVYVVGPPEDTKGFPQLFTRASCSKAASPAEADLVVFTGGPDVDPAFYGEKKHPTTYVDDERDYADMAVYLECLEHGIPMTGVCRGAQFGAAMAGFKLWQDVDNHNGDHTMWDCKNRQMIERVSSVHHQSVMPGAGMEIVGVTHRSTMKYKNDIEYIKAGDASRPHTDVEAFYIPETGFFGVQGHPEYKTYHGFAKWYLDMLYEFFTLNVDFEWRDNRMRLKQDIIDQRPTTTIPQEN